MAYITPITDRTAADVTAKNSKAYLNIVDWNRIYNNSVETHDYILAKIGADVDFDELNEVAIDDIPNKTDLNTLLTNIENMRVWEEGVFSLGLDEVKDDWDEGYSADAPDYEDANLWEQTIDDIYNAVDDAELQEVNIVDESDNPIVDESSNNLVSEIWVIP